MFCLIVRSRDRTNYSYNSKQSIKKEVHYIITIIFLHSNTTYRLNIIFNLVILLLFLFLSILLVKYDLLCAFCVNFSQNYYKPNTHYTNTVLLFRNGFSSWNILDNMQILRFSSSPHLFILSQLFCVVSNSIWSDYKNTAVINRHPNFFTLILYLVTNCGDWFKIQSNIACSVTLTTLHRFSSHHNYLAAFIHSNWLLFKKYKADV